MNMGPFATEQQARAAADHAGLTGTLATRNHGMLTRACWAAHVETGAFDARILAWLANYEPATVAVVAGLITRAHEAGQGRVIAADLDERAAAQSQREVKVANVNFSDGYRAGQRDAALADQIKAIADWMEQRLDDEEYDRQALAESGVTQLRELAALARNGDL